RNFVPAAVLTNSRQVLVSAAKQSSHRETTSVSAARCINTAASRPNVNNTFPITYYYFKAHSPVRRPFNQKSTAKTNNFNEKVNTAKIIKKLIVDLLHLEDTADLQDTGIFSGAYVDEVEGAMADFNNLEPITVVNPIPITRIQKDHPNEQIIRESLSAPQTRRMTKTSQEHDMIIKTTSTPIETNKKLFKDEEAEDVDVYLYKSMIGSLMYLTTSRPDIMFAVCAYVRFHVTPKVSHLHAIKRIFIYLKGQPKLGLWYPRDSPFDLEVFSDRDYVRASLDRKSTTGEYVAAANCYGQATAKVKNVNEEARIQALIDKKKVIITEASIRRDLRFKDERGVDCLSNEVIFKQLTLMGYEKLSQKLTFYKAFFSLQLKFLTHTILQCLSAKTTAWNEFSSTMASAIIRLATNQKFNFSMYIFDNIVKHLDGGVKNPDVSNI
nr:hypothetical protein [Tanacetum cinerariifolium]